MALQNTGAISLNDIHVEAGGTTGTQASINDEDIRGLISKGSGAQMSFSEWYGASAVTAPDPTYFNVDVVRASYQGTAKDNSNIFKSLTYFNVTGTNQTDWDFGTDLTSNSTNAQTTVRSFIDDLGLSVNGYAVPGNRQVSFNATVQNNAEQYVVKNMTVTKFTQNNIAYRIGFEFSTYLPNQMNQTNGFNSITSLGIDYLPTKVIPVNDANQNANAFGGTNVNSSFGMFGWHANSFTNAFPIQMSVVKRVVNSQHRLKWRFYYYLPQLQKAGNSTGANNDTYTSMYNVLPNSATTYSMNEYKFYDFVSTSGLTFPTLTAPTNNYVTGLTFYGNRNTGINTIGTSLSAPTARAT